MNARIVILGWLMSIVCAHVAHAQEKPKKAIDWTKKHIAFEMRAKPWAHVLEWFADQTQLPYTSQYPPPTGTFTFVNPKDEKGNPRQYSLNDVFDILNEIPVANHKFTLVRWERGLTIVPADEPIPAVFIRRVRLEDLSMLHRTEVVEVMASAYYLQGLPETLERQLAEMEKETPRPRVPPRMILIRYYDVPPGKAESWAKVLRAAFAEESLQRLASDGSTRIHVFADQDTHERIAKMIAILRDESQKLTMVPPTSAEILRPCRPGLPGRLLRR